MSQKDSNRAEVVEIDVADVNSVHELHQRLAAKLGFPDFYGHNWDAFWDTITGLVSMPRRLVVRGWSNVQQRWPSDAAKMLACLQNLNERDHQSTCHLELHP